MRRLYRSESDRILFGVCGGLGEYFDIDPTLVRLAWAVAVVFGGTGLLLYVIAVLLMPPRSRFEAFESVPAAPTPPGPEPAPSNPRPARSRGRRA